ncbi:MAG: DUF4345 domain-containing protein [Alphaproteobacteria bacterium]|nr:MAG: DUF4345 domain-containing protein [Alphaproteobacteria bacterium]
MTPQSERRLLQIAIAIGSLVPLAMGTLSILRSAHMLHGVEGPLPIDLDSHFRYLSGLLLGIGIVFLAMLPRVERAGSVFRALGLIVVVGGLARLLSLIENGAPGPAHLGALGIELGAVPLIVLWQARVARRCAS